MNAKKIKIIIAAIGIILAVTLVPIAIAELLLHDGEINAKAYVKQAIVFDDKEDNSAIVESFNVTGGCTNLTKHKITNRNKCVEGTVDLLNTTYTPDGEGITTTIYQVPQYTTLALNNKDSSWIEIDGDGIEGILTFETMKPTFDYAFDAIGLDAETDYCLIYYADPWTGANPGALIDTFTTDDNGTITAIGSVDLGMNLPQEADENHLDGAKIWLVLASDYDETTQEMTGWNPSEYLFEHELTAYTDCDLTVESWLAILLGEPIVCDLTIPPATEIGLILSYHFDIHIVGQLYTMSTKAIPVYD